VQPIASAATEELKALSGNDGPKNEQILPGGPNRVNIVGGKAAPKEVEFQGWLKNLGLPAQEMRLWDSFPEGRGLQGKRSIPKGTQVLKIPSAVVVTTSKASADLGGAARCEGLNEWSIIATWLAAERLKGDASRYAPYVETLPTKCGSVLEWPPNEVIQLLGKSPTGREALGRIQSVQKVTPELISRFPELNLEKETIVWAFSMLFSRLVRLDEMGGELALCPWADMLNHQSGSPAHISYDKEADSVVITTEKEYLAGDQVFTSYGERSSSELLLSYGFVPPAEHPNEFVEVTVGLQATDPMLEAKKAALQRRGKKFILAVPMRLAAIPKELLAFASFAGTTCETEEAVEELAKVTIDDAVERNVLEDLQNKAENLQKSIKNFKPFFGGRAIEQDNTAENTVAGRRLLAAVLRRMQEEYPSDFDEDRKLAQPAAKRGAMAETKGGRALTAAAVRYRERIILARAETVCRQEAGELERMKASIPTAFAGGTDLGDEYR
jgi:hypothetical protein